jgi:hypothetical protein
MKVIVRLAKVAFPPMIDYPGGVCGFLCTVNPDTYSLTLNPWLITNWTNSPAPVNLFLSRNEKIPKATALSCFFLCRYYAKNIFLYYKPGF